MPNPKRRSSKSSQMPAKTTNVTPQTGPNRPHHPLYALLKGTEMKGNERDFAKIAAMLTPPPHSRLA